MKDKKELKVVLINPPTKEEAELIIDKISKDISNAYSQKQIKSDLVEKEWKRLLKKQKGGQM